MGKKMLGRNVPADLRYIWLLSSVRVSARCPRTANEILVNTDGNLPNRTIT